MAYSIKCFTKVYENAKDMVFFTSYLFDMGNRLINCMVSRMLFFL